MYGTEYNMLGTTDIHCTLHAVTLSPTLIAASHFPGHSIQDRLLVNRDICMAVLSTGIKTLLSSDVLANLSCLLVSFK